LKIKAQVRAAAMTGNKPSDIIAPILADASKFVALPSTSNLAQIVRRVKKTANNELKDPKEASEFEVPEHLKGYKNG
jgi:hypothetical protein